MRDKVCVRASASTETQEPDVLTFATKATGGDIQWMSLCHNITMAHYIQHPSNFFYHILFYISTIRGIRHSLTECHLMSWSGVMRCLQFSKKNYWHLDFGFCNSYCGRGLSPWNSHLSHLQSNYQEQPHHASLPRAACLSCYLSRAAAPLQWP